MASIPKLLSSYNVPRSSDNLVNNQLRNYLLNQLQSFECNHMFLNRFLLAYQNVIIH